MTAGKRTADASKSPTRRRLALFAVIGVGALATGLYSSRRRADPSDATEKFTRSDGAKALFATTLPDAAGAETPLARWEGRPLVVNFWATWCPPCIEEMPDFQRVRDEFIGRGVEVVGIGVDSASAIAAFRTKLGISYPLLVAGSSGAELARAFGNSAGGLPFTVVLDKQGAVKHRKLGRVQADSLRSMIGTVLG